MAGFLDDLAAPFGVPAGGGGGAKLLSRRWFLAGGSLVVPAGATWLSGRGCGMGGQVNSGYPGAGGAFARRDISCSPGKSIDVSVGYPSTITLDGVLILKAINAVGASPGQAGDCIGDVVASGGNVNQAGQNGGAGGLAYNGQPGGGGSGGESNAADALIMGGGGGHRFNQVGGNGFFPGGGACYSDYVAFTGSPGNGLVIIEFWTGKP